MGYNPGVQDRSGELLAQGILSGAQSLAGGMERGQERAEQAKRLRKALAALYPERKMEFETFGLNDLQGEADAIAIRRTQQIEQEQSEFRKEQGRLMKAQADRSEEDALSDYLYNRQVAASSVSPQLKAVVGDLASPTFAPLDLASYAPLDGAEQPAPSVPDLRAYMAQAGMRPERQMQMAEALKAFGALEPRSTFAPGATVAIPGRPDLTGVVVSPNGSISVMPMKERKNLPEKPEEQFLPDGTSTGWILFPDGTHRRKPNGKDVVDAARFDTDGDGILSQQEWTQSMLADKTGGLFPGMKTGGGKSQPAGGLWERFQIYKQAK